MWKLYLLLKPAIDNRELEKNIADEIFKIIDIASPQSLLDSLHIMYDNRIRFNTPMEFNILFTNGLVNNEFFYFCKFIGELNGFSKQ